MSLLERQRKEMDRQADRYAMPLGRFWLYSQIGDLRINYEVNEKQYRAAHFREYPMFPEFTMPIEPTWWHTIQYRPFKLERGGWVEEA